MENKLSEEYLVLVDKNDNSIGLEEKVTCHLPNGKLHRAFTALLFDGKGRLILTKRSKDKMLWPGIWDGTVASHPRESETYITSGERRMPEELGISCKLDYLFKFEYHIPYKDIGSENEICGTLIGIIDDDIKFQIIEDEIDEVKMVDQKELLSQIKIEPHKFCPWMLLALELLKKSNNSNLKKYEQVLRGWLELDYQEAIRFHFPENNWRLLK